MSEFSGYSISTSSNERVLLALTDLLEYQDSIRSGRVAPLNEDAYEVGVDTILGSLSPDERVAVLDEYNQIFNEEMKEN